MTHFLASEKFLCVSYDQVNLLEITVCKVKHQQQKLNTREYIVFTRVQYYFLSSAHNYLGCILFGSRLNDYFLSAVIRIEFRVMLDYLLSISC